MAVTVQVGDPPTLPAVPDWARCPEWWDTARAVGWPEGQLPTVDYVVHRESRCNPSATGILVGCCRALGLMQLLGWQCPPNGCYDPTSNLSKALELWHRSGWRPWCLAGDRVTGGC